jgi:hypothetical protein
MTRTTDDLQPTEPWRPLGEKVVRSPPSAPAAPSPQPQGPYGVVQGPDGRLSTTTLPKG